MIKKKPCKLGSDTRGMLELLFPIGIIYKTECENINPYQLMGFGEWKYLGEDNSSFSFGNAVFQRIK